MTPSPAIHEHDDAAAAGRGGWLDVEPIPRRFWWLKRLLILAAAMLVALFALRLWWGHVAQQRLDDQIAKYRAAGQLVYAEEFDAQLDAVPDEENAAVLYEAAMVKIVHTASSGIRYEEFIDDPALFDSDPDAAVELFEANAQVLQLVRQARDRPQIAWSTRLKGFLNAPWGLGSNQRALAKLLSFAVTYQFRQGEHARAMETLQDFLKYSQHIAEFPTIISNLIGWACTSVAIRNLEGHAAKLRVHGEIPIAESRLRRAARSRVDNTIRFLLDARPQATTYSRAHVSERVFILDLHKRRQEGMLWGQLGVPTPPLSDPIDWLLDPLLMLDVRRCLDSQAILPVAALEPNLPTAEQRLNVLDMPASIVDTLARPFSGAELQAYDRTMFLHFRLLAQRRMAATALAIRLYEVDHGHRPAELSVLVPDYLPSVPLDPFAEDGVNIRYRLSPEPAILYSLGPNEKDDGGLPRRPRQRNYDIVFYLDGEPE